MNAWFTAFTATFVVSLLPNVLLIFLPVSIFNSAAPTKTIRLNYGKMLLMFAAAGLLGDVFLHILPHIASKHNHHHHHDHLHADKLRISTQSLSTSHTCAVDNHACLNAEFSENIEQPHHHDHELSQTGDVGDHDHHYDHEQSQKGNVGNRDHHDHDDYSHAQMHNHDYNSHDHQNNHHQHEHKINIKGGLIDEEMVGPLLFLTGFLFFFVAEKIANSYLSLNHHGDHNHSRGDHSFKASGWLNLMADSLHNFTDGITIGAAFASGRGLGVAAFLSVVIHEVPHEISDFVILVRSGLTKWQAIAAQFVTALAAFVGTAVGFYFSENDESMQTVLLAFTGGGFVYIAAVNVIPQIVNDEENESSGVLQLLGEVLCFLLGVGLMIAVAKLEGHEH